MSKVGLGLGLELGRVIPCYSLTYSLTHSRTHLPAVGLVVLELILLLDARSRVHLLHHLGAIRVWRVMSGILRDEGWRAYRLEEVDERGHAALGGVGSDILEGVAAHVPQLGQLRVAKLHALRAAHGGGLALLPTQLHRRLGRVVVSRVGMRWACGGRAVGVRRGCHAARYTHDGPTHYGAPCRRPRSPLASNRPNASRAAVSRAPSPRRARLVRGRVGVRVRVRVQVRIRVRVQFQVRVGVRGRVGSRRGARRWAPWPRAGRWRAPPSLRSSCAAPLVACPAPRRSEGT
eukprot:scaffold41074_cov55-Phaeocystis_antarctica.AAC.1